MIGVLEVQADPSSGEQPVDELVCGEAIAGLEIGGHGHRHGRGDAAERIEGGGGRHRIAVGQPERGGDCRARRRYCAPA